MPKWSIHAPAPSLLPARPCESLQASQAHAWTACRDEGRKKLEGTQVKVYMHNTRVLHKFRGASSGAPRVGDWYGG
jgi:hypothetical protein